MRRNPGIGASTEQLLEDPTVWRWGLDERLLDIVENYIGVPVRYYGANVRREIADGMLADTRQWHVDIEDHRAEDGGPFEYISLPHTRQAVRSLRYVSGFVGDAEMAEVVGLDSWCTATGPRWTAVICDTAAVFHRARPPVGRDRHSVTFSWTSRSPILTVPADPFTEEQSQRVRAGLSARQLECLPFSVARR